METIAQEAKRLLKDIPKENWITKQFTNYKDSCCLIGHYKRLKSKNPEDYSVENCEDWGQDTTFRKATKDFLKDIHGLEYVSGADVNNSPEYNGYTEPEIKDRCMHLLDDMIAAGY